MSPVHAVPPEHEPILRMDELRAELAARSAELAAREAFEAKPLPERLALLLERGEETYRGKEVDGPAVLRAVLAWDALAKSPLPEAAKRALYRLPDALAARYASAGTDRALKHERYDAGRALAESLTDDRARVRGLALACLKAVFGRTLGYDPAAPADERKRKQREWTRELRRWWR